MRRIALVDQTKELRPKPGVLKAIAEALPIQIARDFAPAWGIDPRPVRVGGSGDKIHLFDSAKSAALEFGFHDVDPQGLPYAHVFVDGSTSTGSDWLSGPDSVATTIGHEALEMLVDPTANLYAFDGRDLLWACEVCDPVQEQSYGIRAGGMLVPVTDFVLPAFYNRLGQKPFDHMGVLKKPFTLAKGGYAMSQDALDDHEVKGRRFVVTFDKAVPVVQREAKLAGYGRTYWRNLLHP